MEAGHIWFYFYCLIMSAYLGEETPIHFVASKGRLPLLIYLHEKCSGDLNATYSKVFF